MTNHFRNCLINLLKYYFAMLVDLGTVVLVIMNFITVLHFEIFIGTITMVY